MNGSRLEVKQLSDVQHVNVQANWLGVDITEANGGSFLAPIYWVGGIGLINWFFRFPALTSSGTSGAFKLVVPEMAPFPAQRCGVFHQLNVLAPVLMQQYADRGEFQTTMVLAQGSQCALRAQISMQLLNY